MDRFAECVCDIVREISVRYGDGISGWWFDSGYAVDPRGIHNTVSTNMGDWQFPWEMLCTAAEAGNPNAAITINAGIGEHFRYCHAIDYWAGEMDQLDDMPVCSTDDLLQTRWLPIEGNHAWVLGEHCEAFLPSAYEAEDIKRYLEIQLKSGNMVTFNVLTDRDGTFNPKIAAFFEALREGMKIESGRTPG